MNQDSHTRERCVCRGRMWCKNRGRQTCSVLDGKLTLMLFRNEDGDAVFGGWGEGRGQKGVKEASVLVQWLAWIGLMECVNCSNNTAQLIHSTIPPSLHQPPHGGWGWWGKNRWFKRGEGQKTEDKQDSTAGCNWLRWLKEESQIKRFKEQFLESWVMSVGWPGHVTWQAWKRDIWAKI